MAYRKNPSILNRNISLQGLTTADDVYDIINDNVEKLSEFYEIEPAFVLEVLLDPEKLPRKKGTNLPDWSYLGTIKARYVYSQGDGDEIDAYIKPVSPHITVFPLKGEVVNVTTHGGQYYYYNPLNLKNQVNMNRAGGMIGEGKVFPASTKMNRRLAPDHGDVIINGRFGNNIKLGSDAIDYKYPSIKISNRQSIALQQTFDEDYPQVQDINNDGSTINMTSGPHQNNEIIPAADSKHWPPGVGGKMAGNMITISSDKLIFNAKGDPSIWNGGDIHMFAVNKINLNSNVSINMDTSGIITLGDPIKTQRAVKGDDLIRCLEHTLTIIQSFCGQVNKQMSNPAVNASFQDLTEDFRDLRKNFKTFLSKKVHIESDATPEDLE